MTVSRVNKKEKVKEQLKQFVPEGFESMVADLLFQYPVAFKIVRPRNTKLGDFRAGMQGEKDQITVNGNLNPYAFLITTLHEFAHLHTYLEYGNRVKPHGEEWKNAYRQLLVPAIDTGLLPPELVKVLMNSLIRTKASSCSDINLMRILKTFDNDHHEKVFLENIPKNGLFQLQGKKFIKGDLRRNRYLCEEITTRRKYLVHALSEVEPHEQ